MDENQNFQEDAAVVEEDTVEVAEPATVGQAEVLLSLESMIKGHIATLDKLNQELRKHREMVDAAFENSQVYQEHNEKAKEAIKVKSATKQEIMKQPSMIALNNKVKSMRQELKERQDELSDYLLEYQRMTGATTIEVEDGNVLEIVNSAKVVRAR